MRNAPGNNCISVSRRGSERKGWGGRKCLPIDFQPANANKSGQKLFNGKSQEDTKWKFIMRKGKYFEVEIIKIFLFP